VDYIEYGNSSGQLVVYFHGAPGSPEESAIFDSRAKDHNLRILAFDRFAIDSSDNPDTYYQQLAQQIRHKAAGQPVHIIGFSIGAHIALEVGKILQGQLGQTHLISPGAPLIGGGFLDSMAGGLVFKLAIKSPFIFSLLTRFQKLLAAVAPSLLVNMLFASAADADKQLLSRSEFHSDISAMLKHCFQSRVKGYIRDINLYVTWPGDLADYCSSVSIWQGSEDNWSPPAMASYLSGAIPGSGSVEFMQGLSHYSCLYEAAPAICRKLEQI
jgi:pimeloyl-ACP methyl ester carboxylesterase